MKRLFLLIAAALCSQAAIASEPSAFGAGNLDSDNPYGLTSAEKKIVENRQTLQNTKRKIIENSAQLNSLRERLDGMQAILEGLTEKAQTNKKMVGELAAEKERDAVRDEKIAALENAIQAQETNLMSMKTLMEKMASQLDTIDANYVSKEEYNRLVSEVNAFKNDLSKTLKSVSAPTQDPYASIASKDLAAQAKKNYDKLYFRKAIPMYEELIRRSYKPAYAHFMLGEMWHYRKKWSKALSYYKESARRYDKASYMPTLMLHSAECMKHLGDRANATKFLQALMAKYPDSSEAADAKALLNTL